MPRRFALIIAAALLMAGCSEARTIIWCVAMQKDPARKCN